MTDNTFVEMIREASGVIGALTIGGIVGALNRAIQRRPDSIAIAILEGVAATGSGVVFGGLVYAVIEKYFETDTIFAALAAGAICAHAGDKAFRNLFSKFIGERNGSAADGK